MKAALAIASAPSQAAKKLVNTLVVCDMETYDALTSPLLRPRCGQINPLILKSKFLLSAETEKENNRRNGWASLLRRSVSKRFGNPENAKKLPCIGAAFLSLYETAANALKAV